MGFLSTTMEPAYQKGADILLQQYQIIGELPIITYQSNCFSVRKTRENAIITYTRPSEVFRGIGFLVERIEEAEFYIEQTSVFGELIYMIDVSRNGVLTVDSVKRIIRQLALLGYTSLQLYTEDVYEIEGEPYFGYLRGGYSAEDLQVLNDYALDFGIELVPCVQTLGHLSRMFRWRCYYDINEGYDVLLPREEKTYAFLDRMFAQLRKCFTTKKVNVCMDEAHSLGLGVFWELYGEQKEPLNLLVEHLDRINKIAQKHGFEELMMWGDLFLHLSQKQESVMQGNELVDTDIRKRVPENVTLIDWCYHVPDYLEQVIDSYKTFDRSLVYAGCAFRTGTMVSGNIIGRKYVEVHIAACKKKAVRNFMMTTWGDNGSEASFFSVLPQLFEAAELAYGTSADAQSRRFEMLYGISLEDMMLLDLPNMDYRYPQIRGAQAKYVLFSGYFANQYDRHIRAESELDYEVSIARIQEAKNRAGEYTYLFETALTLCEVLKHKISITQKTRELYAKQDKQGLQKLIKTDYEPLVILYEELCKKHQKQWFLECRPYGFEVLEQRYGGMILRTQGAIQRLKAYINNDILKIEELETDILSYLDEKSDGKPIFECDFDKIYSFYKL